MTKLTKKVLKKIEKKNNVSSPKNFSQARHKQKLDGVVLNLDFRRTFKNMLQVFGEKPRT